MALYATAADLTAYLLDNAEVTAPTEPAAIERLLKRAERQVDLVLGPYTLDAVTGLKLTPSWLTPAQRLALSRATCAAAEHELAVGSEVMVGTEDYLPPGLTVLRSAGRQAPKVAEELAGHGLVTRSGCAPSDAGLPSA